MNRLSAPTRLADTPAGAPRDPAPGGLLTGLRGALSRPLASYYLIAGISTLLAALGLVMVLSTSAVLQLAQSLPPYSVFLHQLVGVAAGGVCMWLMSRAPTAFLRKMVYPLVIVTVVALLLTRVPGFEDYSGGVYREIKLGPILVQPSELAKLAFVLWGADLLARKEKLGQLEDWRHLLVPLLPGLAVLALLVMLGKDLGTTFLLLVIFLALLWVLGTPRWLFGGLLAMLALVVLMFVMVQSYRIQRLTAFLTPTSSPAQALSINYQGTNGKWALGSGGLFGVGLGAGSQKWGYVPNDTTDFIFAIVGEELGLVGTLCVTFLYGGLGYAGMRVARRAPDTFTRLAAAGVTAWIVGQALVNIGVVTGLLPITGVPLPLVSSGLSSLLVTMAALGMLMSFAKQEPGAAEALAAAGPGGLRRVLSWLSLERRRQ